VLLAEKSVSLAADRLCLSQSATSSALGRLREYFRDDLLVVKGRAMVLTARAEELIEPVRAVLEQIRTTIAIAPEFDPATCDRQVRIMASDYSAQVLLAGAFAALADSAPHMRFEVMPMGSTPVDLLERGQIDLLLTIDYAISSDHPSQFLFADDYVVVGDAANPAMQGEMTRDKYFALGHVTARFGRSRTPAFDDWFVRRQKTQRRIEVVAPTFLSQAGLVLGTRRIATMHRRLAQQVVQMMPLVMCEVPFDIPPIREAVQWHISNNNDRALRWVVEQLGLCAGQDHPADSSAVPISDSSHDAIAVQFQHNHPTLRGQA